MRTFSHEETTQRYVPSSLSFRGFLTKRDPSLVTCKSGSWWTLIAFPLRYHFTWESSDFIQWMVIWSVPGVIVTSLGWIRIAGLLAKPVNDIIEITNPLLLKLFVNCCDIICCKPHESPTCLLIFLGYCSLLLVCHPEHLGPRRLLAFLPDNRTVLPHILPIQSTLAMRIPLYYEHPLKDWGRIPDTLWTFDWNKLPPLLLWIGLTDTFLASIAWLYCFNSFAIMDDERYPWI